MAERLFYYNIYYGNKSQMSLDKFLKVLHKIAVKLLWLVQFKITFFFFI